MALAIGSVFDPKIIKQFNELTSGALAAQGPSRVRRDKRADAARSVSELNKLVGAGLVKEA